MSCVNCGSDNVETVIEIPDIPVFCNVQHADRDTAIAQPTGDMRLSFCGDCEHFYNAAFDESLLSYGVHYENSLHFSNTFSEYARDLAVHLVERHGLRHRNIIEIGCGKGDFLALMCELGENQGYGFDQSFEPGRGVQPERGNAKYFAEFYSDKHAELVPDLLICRHVLEHIWSSTEFLSSIWKALASTNNGAVYFEVPNALYTIRDFGIWDLIYEHCHYFTEASLTDAFARAGFDQIETNESFGGQFIGLSAMRASDAGARTADKVRAKQLQRTVRAFKERFDRTLVQWREVVLEAKQGGQHTVVWGAGSKGVSFLNFLRLAGEIDFLVDINPHKQGLYTAGTGHKIVAPDELAEFDKLAVFVMNPMYEAEISQAVEALGIDATFHLVN